MISSIFGDLSTVDTVTLMKKFIDLSNELNQLKDTPFCTIRQLEQLQAKVGTRNIFIQEIFLELKNRNLTAEEQEQIKTYMN